MNEDALTAFCRAEYPRLVGMLSLYCGNDAVAEELAQETLARVWRRWPKVHHLDHPEAWARRVAINLANSHFRRVLAERRAMRRLPQLESESTQERGDDIEGLRQVVANLPRRQRVAVILHYYFDLPLEDVAAQMEATIPGVKSLLHRAVKTLRKQPHVKDLLGVPDVS